MSHFGQFLLQRGALTRAQLEEALQAQVVTGGRLGTNVLELGYLDLDELARHLSEYGGVPLPPRERVAAPAAEALAAIPAPLARELAAFPFDLGEDHVDLVMRDPRDPSQLAKLSAAAGRPARGFVLPEVAIAMLFERYLGIAPERRMARLARALREGRGRVAPRPSSVAEALPDGEELIDEQSFARLQEQLVRRPGGEEGRIVPASAHDLAEAEILLDEVAPQRRGAPPVAEAPPASPGEVAQLEARLAGARDRDEIATLAVRLARAYAAHAALFLVHGGTIVGLRAADAELEGRIQGVVVPVATDCALARAAALREPYRGAPPQGPVDGRIARALGRDDAQEWLLLPVCIRDRAVNLLFADNASDAFGETSVAALRALCDAVALAYERLILASKRAERLG